MYDTHRNTRVNHLEYTYVNHHWMDLFLHLEKKLTTKTMLEQLFIQSIVT